MKKLAYVLILMFTMGSLTSCEKDEVPKNKSNPDGGLITLTQLNGKWNFQKYIYQGDEYTTIGSGIGTIFYPNIFNVTNMTWISGTEIYNFSKDENYIKIWYGNDPKYMEYTVVGYDGTELRLRVDYTRWTYNYLGGTLVLKK